MKKTKNKQLMQKIIISLIVAVSCQFIMPNHAKAGWLAGELTENICQFFASIGDVVTGALNSFMLGGGLSDMGSSMLDKTEAERSWIRKDKEGNPIDEELAKNFESDFASEISSVSGSGKDAVSVVHNSRYTGVIIAKQYLESSWFGDQYEYPNMVYSPENIFANNIPLFDINFINPSKYSVRVESIAVSLQPTIASWYKTFRNIAAVGLLSVLLYLGIRIVIGSVNEKAKYKEALKDWLFAMCLLFVMQFIIVAILTITDKFNDIFGQETNNILICVKGDSNNGGNYIFRSNLMGVSRMLIQTEGDNWQNIVAYTIIYFALIIYTCMFTFQYFKRVLYMAFYTMISPLVAMSYPIDKAGDSKAQAFNTWFREVVMTALTQPIHLLLYTMLVSSAMELTLKNPIYGLVCIGFLVPAEKFVKSLFGLQPNADQGMGSFAGGAMTMGLLNKLTHKPPMPKGEKGGADGGDSSSEDNTPPQTKLDSYIGNNGSQPLNPAGDNRNSGDPDPEEDTSNSTNNPNTQPSNDSNQEFANNPNEQPLGNENGYYEGNNNEDEGYSEEESNNNSSFNNSSNNTQESGQQGEGVSRQEPSRRPGEQRPSTASEPNGNNFGKKLKRARPIAGKVFKAGAKGLTRIGAIGGGALIGAAAGLTTGDMSKVFTNAAAGGIAGNAIGKNVTQIPGGVKNLAGKVSNAMDKASVTATEINSGYAAAEDKRKAIAKERDSERFMKDKKQRERYKKIAAKIEKRTGKQYDINELMKAASDYRNNDVTDNDTIEKGLIMEAKNGGVGGQNHNKMIGVATLAQKYDESYIFDEKKNKTLKNEVVRQVGKENGDAVMKDFEDFHLKATEEVRPRRTQTRTRSSRGTNTNTNTNSTNGQNNSNS